MKHHISHANSLFWGGAYHENLFAANERKGAPLTPITKVSFGSPAALDADGAAAAQAVAGAGNLTLNGALATAGVVTFDVPRSWQAVSDNLGDTTQTLTATGTDVYGATLQETITLSGTTVVNGKKAFKTITQIAVSASTVGNVSAGSTDVLGLPYRAMTKADVMQVWFNDVVDTSAVVVKGDATTATATTGDIRGTVDPNSATDGSAIVVWMAIDPTDRFTLAGIAQFGG